MVGGGETTIHHGFKAKIGPHKPASHRELFGLSSTASRTGCPGMQIFFPPFSSANSR